MNVILVLVFFLSLMFLAMIFGEKLSLFGFVDGRWLTAPFDMASRLWDMVCEATDRVWCFVFEHFWWVAATVSGGIGVLLVALLMVGGLSKEAAAVRLEEQSVMSAGSVLDHIAVLNARNILVANVATPGNDVSHKIYQARSRFDMSFPLSNQRPIVRDLPERATDVPPLPLPRYREPDYSRSRLMLTMEPLAPAVEWVEQVGRPVRSRDIERLIERAVLSLRSDDWRPFADSRSFAGSLSSRPALTEDSDYAVRDLASRVRVIPGDVVSSSNLKVEKSAPQNSGPGDFEIQIRVTNLSRDRVSGVVVREFLPAAWVPKTMQPRGVFRDATATWLVDDLGPQQDQVLTLQVESTDSGRFQSVTEVSAMAAVTSDAHVVDQELPLPPVRRPVQPSTRPSGRTSVQLPNVRLVLEEPLETVTVGEWTTVYFRIENIGNAAANGVSLRVTLPVGLNHHALKDNDLNRQVDSNVRRLDAGDSRRTALRVRPTSRRRHFATAELLLQDSQLDVQPFEIVARETVDRQPLPTPDPDFR